VRRWMCVPMMTLCLLLTACGSKGEEPQNVRSRYQEMSGCTMEAVVTCEQDGAEWEAVLRCDYLPGEKSTVVVLEPEILAGVKATVQEDQWQLEYQDVILNAGTVSDETISPAICLPWLMSALRDGWLLEENQEVWNEVPCLRYAVDQAGEEGEIVSTLWIRQDDGTPLRGEISVEGENILTAEFTSFSFYDTIN